MCLSSDTLTQATIAEDDAAKRDREEKQRIKEEEEKEEIAERYRKEELLRLAAIEEAKVSYLVDSSLYMQLTYY